MAELSFFAIGDKGYGGSTLQGEDVPRHTYHFSPAVLAKYAEKYGFEVGHVSFDDGIFDGRGKGTFRWMLSERPA